MSEFSKQVQQRDCLWTLVSCSLFETEVMRLISAPLPFQENQMKTTVTTLETRFNTILPTLATKEDLNNLEVKLT